MAVPVSPETMDLLWKLPQQAKDEAAKCALQIKRSEFLNTPEGEAKLHRDFVAMAKETLAEPLGNKRHNRLLMLSSMFPAQYKVLAADMPYEVLTPYDRPAIDKAKAGELAEKAWKETLTGFKASWAMGATSCTARGMSR